MSSKYVKSKRAILSSLLLGVTLLTFSSPVGATPDADRIFEEMHDRASQTGTLDPFNTPSSSTNSQIDSSEGVEGNEDTSSIAEELTLEGIMEENTFDELMDTSQLEQFDLQIELLDARIQELDNQIIEAMERVEHLNKEVRINKFRVDKAKVELKEAEEKHQHMLGVAQEQVRLAHKNNNKGSLYLEVIFGSESFGDLITRASSLSTLLDSSYSTVEELKKTEINLEERRQNLSSRLSSLSSSRLEAIKESKRIQELQAQVEEELQSIQQLREEENERLQEEYRQQVEELLAEAVRLEQERLEAERLENERLELERLTQLSQLQAQSNALQGRAFLQTFDSSQATDVSPKLAQRVISRGFDFLGVPYLWGGTTPSGFDCSGLLQYIYREVGVNLPRVSRDQQRYGTRIPLSEIQPGDLIFKNVPATHVAVYIGDGKYLHAPRTGDVVKISNYNPNWWDTATRVLPSAPRSAPEPVVETPSNADSN